MLPSAVAERLPHLAGRGVGLMLLAAVVFTALALASWSVTDP